MQFREIEWLTFSFKNIARICNLEGLDKLTRLQLDNNVIAKIEHLDHLVGEMRCYDIPLVPKI